MGEEHRVLAREVHARDEPGAPAIGARCCSVAARAFVARAGRERRLVASA